MFEFKVIENLKPNKSLTDILKEFKYKVILNYLAHQPTNSNAY